MTCLGPQLRVTSQSARWICNTIGNLGLPRPPLTQHWGRSPAKNRTYCDVWSFWHKRSVRNSVATVDKAVCASWKQSDLESLNGWTRRYFAYRTRWHRGNRYSLSQRNLSSPNLVFPIIISQGRGQFLQPSAYQFKSRMWKLDLCRRKRLNSYSEKSSCRNYTSKNKAFISGSQS